MIETTFAYPEADLPEWELELLDPTLQNKTVNEDPFALVVDTKDERRIAYQNRHKVFQDHGTQGQEHDPDRRFVRQYKAYDISRQENNRPSKSALIEESLSVITGPQEDRYAPDYLEEDDYTDDIRAPFTYHGPYNPLKERARMLEARAKEMQATHNRAEHMLEKLTNGNATPDEALRGLLEGVYGEERERILSMLHAYMGPQGYEDINPKDEFGAVIGAGSIAAKKTLELTPYEDIDYLDGFHIVDETRL